MNKITKKQKFGILALIFILFVLPALLFLVRRSQDIRPRALQGQVNLLLNTDAGNLSAGDMFNVLVSLEVTSPEVKISGVDFVLLYDREALEVYSIKPETATSGSEKAFTDVLIANWGDRFPNSEEEGFDFLRVSQVSRRPSEDLFPNNSVSRVIQLATITFRAKSQGDARIKFPDNNKYLEVVGISDSMITPMADGSLPTIGVTENPPTNIPIPTTIPIPPSATIVPTDPQTGLTCKWCGTSCVDAASAQNCIMIAPPQGWQCQAVVIDGVEQCVVITPTPAKAKDGGSSIN